MKCVIIQPIHSAGLEVLRAGGVEPVFAPSTDLADLAPLLSRAEAVITRNWGFPAEAVALSPSLRVVGVHGSGTDRVAMTALRDRAIVLFNTPGTNAQSVAEHALALMLAVARGIPAGDNAMKTGDFAYRERFSGLELSGLCLGLWGWGSVAHALAPMGLGLGMEVLALSGHAGEDELTAMGVTPAKSVDHLLTASDVVSLHGRPGAGPVLGRTEISRMRAGAILINTARGALIDEEALGDALRAGHLFGAGLDVLTQEPPTPASPLLGCPRLILTPHIGGTTEAASRRTAQAVARKVVSALRTAT
jgi:phosphoglycerate dehydrogenase-like enzyme